MNKLLRLEKEIESQIQMLKEDIHKADVSIGVVAKIQRLVNYRISILNDVLEMIDEIKEEK